MIMAYLISLIVYVCFATHPEVPSPSALFFFGQHAHQVHRPIAQRSIRLWHAIQLPIIHQEAQHFSNSVKFKQNYTMPWNICFFRTNFALVKTNKQTKHTILVQNHHSRYDESGLGIALIMKNPQNLSACKKISQQTSLFRSALTRLLHPTGKYSIVWKLIIHISIRFKFNRYFMCFLNV